MSRPLLLSFLLITFSLSLAAQDELHPLEQALSGIVTVGVYDVDDQDVVLGFGTKDEGKSYAEIAYEKTLNMGDAFSNGSGFVIELDGDFYIVTNAHVIDAASREAGAVFVYSVLREKYPARIIGGDTFYDLAILEFDGVQPGPEIQPLEFSEVEAHLAQKVYAIGNPLGKYPYTITEGIVSGKNRLHYRPTTGRFGFLQHTATLIWGNSGGPLVDESGRVVGINTYIGTHNKNGQDYLLSQLNFALEGQRARQLLKNIIENGGRLKRPFLGLEFASTANPNEPEGLPVIKGVLPDAPAAESLNKWVGATITQINGEAVQTLPDIVRIMEGLLPGATVTLKLRRGMTSPEITLTAEELTNQRLEDVAKHFFSTYSDYSPEENAAGIALKGTKDYVQIERYKSAGQGEEWAVFERIEGKKAYGLAGLGGMSRQGTLGTYQVKKLRDLGAIIRLYSIEGHLGATLVEGTEYAGTIRFFLEDEDLNELKVLYY